MLAPLGSQAETITATNAAQIVINDYNNGDSAASPYPSTINVSGLTNQVAQVTVTLWGLNHGFCSDISMMLVNPSGQGVVLMSQVGGLNAISVSRLTFDDNASLGLPYIGNIWVITNGVYRPTDGVVSNYFVPTAPVGPYGNTLSFLNGSNPNGAWSLYVEDEAPDDSGVITNGWSLSIVTAPFYDGINLTDPAQVVLDLDGDGLSNLIEYALGTDPRDPADAGKGMLITTTSSAGNEYVSLQYRRRKNTAGLNLQYLPEVSGDSQTWNSDASHVLSVGVTPIDAQFDLVTVRDLTPTTSSAPRFIRLRVVEN